VSDYEDIHEKAEEALDAEEADGLVASRDERDKVVNRLIRSHLGHEEL
jgi:hypothetical protein